MSDQIAKHVRIHGRVQGVFFRAWTTEKALERGLRGWVRNRDDGSVEAVFYGPAARVDEMISLCRQGPDRADVTDIDIEPSDPPAATSFEMRASV